MSSNIFLSSNINSGINTTENTTTPSWLTVNITENNQNGGDNVTSDLFLSQIKDGQINQLINMVTSVEQQHGGKNTLEETSTEKLEQELRDIISGQYTDRSKKTSKKYKSRKSSKKRKSRKSSKKTSKKRKSRKSSKKTSKKRKSCKSSKKTSKKRKSRKSSKKTSMEGGAKKRKSSKKTSKKRKSRKGSKKTSKKRKSRKGSKKTSKKRKSRKGSKKTSMEGGARKRKSSKKTSKCKSSKTSKRKSSKTSKRKSSKTSKRKSSKTSKRKSSKSLMKGGNCQIPPENDLVGGAKPSKPSKPSKRKAQPWMKMQVDLVKQIREVEKDITYIEGIKLLKSKYIKYVIGKPYVKDGDISWADALKKIKETKVKVIYDKLK
jgi:hypothetical protein